MIAKAFCELFVAGCLEVDRREVDGETQRVYRVVDDVDPSLLDRVERLVVDYLRTFRSFAELLAFGRRHGAAALGSAAGAIPSEAELLAEMGEVIDDALEYLPPACSCSV